MSGGTFSGCTSLVSVGDLSNVTIIGGSAFYGCTSLVSVGDLSNLIEIHGNAFRNCSSIERLNLTNTLTIIGSGVFPY